MIFLLFALDQWGGALASAYLPSSAFTNILVAGMTAFAIIILFAFGRPHRLLSGPAFWLVVTLFIYAFVSIFWVSVPGKAMAIWSVNFQYLVVFILGAPLLIQEVDDLEVPMRALLLLGTPFIFCLNFMLEWGYRGFHREWRGHAPAARSRAVWRLHDDPRRSVRPQTWLLGRAAYCSVSCWERF